VVIPKSEKEHRIKSNADVFDFELSDADMKEIDAMNQDWHCTWDPYSVQY
jgi:diketogulonate reductase-like aldo/keto reductase